jgi:hypothetical protein
MNVANMVFKKKDTGAEFPFGKIKVPDIETNADFESFSPAAEHIKVCSRKILEQKFIPGYNSQELSNRLRASLKCALKEVLPELSLRIFYHPLEEFTFYVCYKTPHWKVP